MIALALVKSQLRVDGSDEDELIQSYIDAALSAFELWTNRALVDPVAALPDPLGNALLMTKAISHGAIMLIAHWHANRESVVVGAAANELPLSTMALWTPHRWVNI